MRMPFLIIMFLCFVFLSLMLLLSSSEEGDSKNSPFESGFDSKNLSVSFSNQYYLVAILFLVFDLEIVLSFPIPLSLSKSSFLGSLFFFVFYCCFILWVKIWNISLN